MLVGGVDSASQSFLDCKQTEFYMNNLCPQYDVSLQREWSMIV